VRRPSPSPLAETGDAGADGFAQGRGDGGTVLFRARSALTLAPTELADLTTGALPDRWYVETTKEGGSATFGDGHLALDGACLGADTMYSAGCSVEFSARFGRRPHQHAGLGVDFTLVPWVAFSTKFGNSLYARTHFYLEEDERLDRSLISERHVFRIDWNVLDVGFFVDGAQAAHLLVPVPGFMRPLAGSFSLGEPLELEWMRLTPFRPAGEFTSRVFDAGAEVRWDGCDWEADAPAGTGVAVDVRTGPSPEPGPGWSGWAAVAEPGGALDAVARFAQYRARLHTTVPRATPTLRRVTLAYAPV
jgi:hypothetical protein